jgi:hypothetical protein
MNINWIGNRLVKRRRASMRIIGLLSTLTVSQFVCAGRAEAQTGIGPVDWVIDGVGDLVGGGIGAVAAKVANTIFEKVLEFVASLIADAVIKATELLISVFDAIDVKVGSDGVLTGAASSKLYLQMVALGTFLVTLLWMVRLASALIHQQMGQVARELFFDLPFTIIGTVAAGAIGWIFLNVTNEMASAFSADFATNIGSFASEFFTKDVLLSGGIFSMLFALIYILGAIMVGLELIIRAGLLTIIFAVAPVMISTRTWEGTRRYSRKFIETAMALLFAKPAAAFALALGTAQLSDAVDKGSPVKLMIGTTITVLAAFMPFALFKLIPVVEGAAVQQGIKGAPVRVAQTIAGLAASAAIIKGAGASSGGATGAAGMGGTAGSSGPTTPSSPGGAPPPGSSTPNVSPNVNTGSNPGSNALPGINGSFPSSSAVPTAPLVTRSESPPSGDSLVPQRSAASNPTATRSDVAIRQTPEPTSSVGMPPPSGSTSPGPQQFPSTSSGSVRAKPVSTGRARAASQVLGSIPTSRVAFADDYFDEEDNRTS